MKTQYLSLVFLLGLITIGCSDSKTEGNATDESSAVKAEVSDVSPQEDYAEVIDAYLDLKDALVRSDAGAASIAGTELRKAVEAKISNDPLAQSASKIGESNDLEEQRTAFKQITDQLVELLPSPDNELSLYVQYCPMAFDNTGASWISNSEEIRNPYFGDKMLKCGRVEREL